MASGLWRRSIYAVTLEFNCGAEKPHCMARSLLLSILAINKTNHNGCQTIVGIHNLVPRSVTTIRHGLKLNDLQHLSSYRPIERGNRSERHRVSWRNPILIVHWIGSVRIKLQQHQELLRPSSPKKPEFHRGHCLWHCLSLYKYLFVSVSINIRNGVTGSLDDPATLKLVDQEDQDDEDLLPQAVVQDVPEDDAPSLPESSWLRFW